VTENEGWPAEAAARYLRMANVLVPGRRNVLAILADLATAFAARECSFLDLGCGSGDVTAAILKRRPNASVFMADFSDEMIRIARHRFRANARVRVVKHNLDTGVPEGLRPGQFDAVVSCFATHHVQPDNRPKLYRDVRRVLHPDGVFVNGDRFVGEAPAIDRWEHESWVTWTAKRTRDKLGNRFTVEQVRNTQAETDQRLGDRPGTIWEMSGDLRNAGFRYVDCLLKTRIIAVLAASGRRD